MFPDRIVMTHAPQRMRGVNCSTGDAEVGDAHFDPRTERKWKERSERENAIYFGTVNARFDSLTRRT